MNAAAAAPRRARWPKVLGAVLLAVVVVLGICEALGWPFLAAPLQKWLSTTLERRVSFEAGPGAEPTLNVRFLGGLRVRAPHLLVAAPAWSQAPHLMRATDADLRLRYVDLWRAYQGGRLRIRSIKAAELDGTIERLKDGRASWQFGSKPPDASKGATAMPVIDELLIGAGSVAYRDALMQLDLDSRFALRDSSSSGVPASTSAPASASLSSSTPAAPAAAASQAAGLELLATGTYREKIGVKVDVKTSGVLPLLSDEAATIALPITLDATVGNGRMTFQGTATDALRLSQLRGRFHVDGPSLAAVGEPLGVTLPTTAAFRTDGLILKEGRVWNTVFERATVGDSSLTGAFKFDASGAKPVLSGRLNGSRLLLADLGPAVGGQVRTGDVAAAKTPEPPRKRNPDKVLPDRPFDLPSLRAMDANVLVDIADFDLGSELLQPLRPLRAHLILADGVLTLKDIDARTADGQLAGMVSLDGRGDLALWKAGLRWDNVRLERWIKQSRGDGAPPFVSGRLNGSVDLTGQGQSTAAILGSLKGGVRTYLLGGTVSHLIVEGAGIDVAQALGVFVKGDDALPVQCMVADMVADKGQLRPRALVLDTGDSTLWVEGSLSLATEALDLRAVVLPKDFSPLALRSPVTVKGTFAAPAIGVEAKPIAMRAGAAALLALVNPFAAVLPLLDFGSSDEARRADANCRALAQRTPTRLGPSPATSAKARAAAAASPAPR